MCQTKIATFEHYFQLLSNLKIIIIQRRRNIWVFLNFYSRFNHVPARAFAWLSVQSFRLLPRVPPACSPDLLPIHSPDLLPSCSPLSFFRLLNKYARLARHPRTYLARALARRPRLCRLSKRSSHKAQGSRSAIPRRWKSVSRMPRKEWYND